MTIQEYARLLRQNSTKAEKILWHKLRNRKFRGLKFRRQSVIAYRFIADFYCAEKKLIVEVDGGIHELAEVKLNDKVRAEDLIDMGYHIIRFKNEEVESDSKEVLLKLAQFIDSL